MNIDTADTTYSSNFSSSSEEENCVSYIRSPFKNKQTNNKILLFFLNSRSLTIIQVMRNLIVMIMVMGLATKRIKEMIVMMMALRLNHPVKIIVMTIAVRLNHQVKMIEIIVITTAAKLNHLVNVVLAKAVTKYYHLEKAKAVAKNYHLVKAKAVTKY